MLKLLLLCGLFTAICATEDHVPTQSSSHQQDLQSQLQLHITPEFDSTTKISIKTQSKTTTSKNSTLKNATMTGLDQFNVKTKGPKRNIIQTNYKKSRKHISIVKVPMPEELIKALFVQGKQIPPLPADPLGGISMLVSNGPCKCAEGLCGCCTGMFLQAFNSMGCMNMKYIPEDFAFEFQMKMGGRVLYKNRVSGKNPPPICINPPRFPIIEVCAKFHDVYFAGRNVHLCLDVSANFQGYELFQRDFDCMRLGSQGLAVVKPEEGSGLPTNTGGLSAVDADVDAGGEIEDYDDTLFRSLKNSTDTKEDIMSIVRVK